MRSFFSLVLAFVVTASVAVLSQGQVAFAAFHCMRIHAVSAGFNGDNKVQFVELRMDVSSQTALGGHQVQFFDSGGTLKATFTFPNGVTHGSVGDSILIATSEFNGRAVGGAADFTFSNANTTGNAGGDPLHPVQGVNGTVVWATGSLSCGSTNPVDAVAYGTGTGGFGPAATALPGPSTNQALRLGNLNITPSNNSTEYSLDTVSTTTFAVAPASLASDFRFPRNNGRQVLAMEDAILGGQDGGAPSAVASSDGGHGLAYGLAAGIAAAAVVCGAGWYVFRVRARAE